MPVKIACSICASIFSCDASLPPQASIASSTSVVIGGSPALADSPFMEAARSALRDYNTESLGIHLRLRMGQLPERQYALGGCYLVFDHMFRRPKLALTVV